MKLRILLIVALLVLASSSGQLSAGQLRQAQPPEPGPVVEPEVTDALQGASDVDVFISLRPPETLGVPTVEELRESTPERAARVLSALAPGDLEVSRQYELIPLLTGTITQAGVDKLASHDDVLRISLPPVIVPSLAESVPVIDADYVHSQGIDGSGVTVAVLDSGIDTDHPDLADDIAGEACFLVLNRCPPDYDTSTRFGPGSAEDDLGHGTNISGIITSGGAIAPLGVAPSTKIFAYKVADYNGNYWGVFDAFQDIMDERQGQFAAISMSFHDEPDKYADECDEDEPAWALPLSVIRSQGTVPFAATGNDGDKALLPAPACISSVVAVGATYDADVGSHDWAVCTDATTAVDKVACASNSSDKMELVAPGSVTTTTSFDGQTEDVSGTSFSVPHAVAVAALMREALPALTPEEIEFRLIRTGKFVTDGFDPANIRTTPRIDARVALLTDDGDDFDLDGCTNGREFQDDPGTGGLRNPLNFWDFFDVPAGSPPVRDKVVGVGDINEIVARFGATGDAGGDPLSPPPPAPAYHTAYDRDGTDGPNNWNLLPADGAIVMQDIFAAVGQFGHSCA